MFAIKADADIGRRLPATDVQHSLIVVIKSLVQKDTVRVVSLALLWKGQMNCQGFYKVHFPQGERSFGLVGFFFLFPISALSPCWR